MQFRRSQRVSASLVAAIVSTVVVGGLCTIIFVGSLQVIPLTAACTHLLLTYLYIVSADACDIFALAPLWQGLYVVPSITKRLRAT